MEFKKPKQNLYDKEKEVTSMLEAAQEFVGCLESGIGDISLKKKELK
ncbi:MAG: hypothetical protein QNJ74_12820 [Trichodesmium sp. MO_231.B1]|nr:hypothetical protein [Trichodesmium sp. MO_231.B1]